MTAVTAQAPPETASSGRERYLDVYRAIALVRVVIYHVFGFAWLTILFPAMGVMFAVAGSLTARSLNRTAAGDVVWSRVRRVLPSLWALGIVVVPAMLMRGWSSSAEDWPARWHELLYWIVPVFDPPASDWAVNAAGPIWYIRAYLWFVALSPLLLWAYRRWPVATVLAPLTLVALNASGAIDYATMGAPGAVLRDFATYGACWVLGFAHRSGDLRRIPLWAAATLSALAATGGLAWAFTHPTPQLGYDLNAIPPGQALLSAAVVLMLLRWAPDLDVVDRLPVVGRVIAVITARAVTIYLWHNIAIDLALVINHSLGLYSGGQLLLTTGLLTTVAIVLFGWVEDLAAGRPIRLFPSTRPAPSAASRPQAGAHKRPVLAASTRFGAGAVSALLLAAWLAPPIVRHQTTPEPTFSVAAYVVPWDEDRAMEQLPDAAPALDSISPVWYTPTESGELVRNDDTRTGPVAEAARELGLSVIPSISNYRDDRWDVELVSEIVNDRDTRREHVAAIVETVVEENWDGIDIDYEALPHSDDDAFGRFITELGRALHAEGRTLTVALAAGTAETRAELAPLYRTVGAAADEVRVMAYDLAWNGSPPGPIAPVDWVEDVLRFTVRYVEPWKVRLGLAAHGYDWAAGADGRDLMYAEAVERSEDRDAELQWNMDAQAPWFTYEAKGVEHTVWFEDAPSLAAKLEVAAAYQVGGVFLWRMGGEDPRIWPVLEQQ